MEHVYIHIPFCLNICSYCDFCKMFYHEKYIEPYFEALTKEIDEFYQGENIKTIYVGGGTPSILNSNELQKLFSIIKVFKKAQDCEFSFECNVEDINEELLLMLKDNDVNRLSIGIQSFNQDKLKFMERSANFKDVDHKIKLVRKLGFNNINLDLMYGIPNETLDELRKDVKLFLKLKPEHISTYALIVEDYTKVKINNFKNIPEEEEFKMYEYICKKLTNNKFKHYEISNFAINGYESKHNLAYWDNHEYYGFGLGAAGYINGFRYENTKNIDNYINGKFRNSESLLSKQEIMDYEIMLGLRKIKGINIKEFEEKYGIILEDNFPIKPLIKNKDLILKNGYLFISPKRIYLMNEILLKMI